MSEAANEERSATRGVVVRTFLLATLLTALALTAGLVLFLATGQDDPYITFWPAYTLVEMGEIVNYNGDRVEQSSSLLHTLLLAGASLVTRGSLPLLAYWMGVLFGGLAAVRAVALARRLGARPPAALALLVASSPCFLYWCFGSLETTIAAWLSIETAIVAARLVGGSASAFAPRTLAVTAAFLAVRPEGGFIVGAALAGWIAAELLLRRLRQGDGPPARIAEAAKWLAVVALLVAGLGLFRWLYFGQLFPQPVMVKVGGDLVRSVLKGGVYVLGLALPRYGPVMLVAIVLAPFVVIRELRRPTRDHAFLAVLFLLAAHVGFVITTGGDWMPGRRFVVHFMPLGLVVLYVVLRSLPLPRVAYATTLVAWLVVNVAGVGLFAVKESSGRPLWAFLEKDEAIREQAGGFEYAWPERANQIHERDVLMIDEVADVIERLIVAKREAGVDERVSLMSGQAGMINYYLARRYFGEIEFVDRFALTTRHMMPFKEERGLRASAYGLNLPLDLYFDAGRTREGPAWHPDVIVEIDADLTPKILRRGYVLVYEQVGVASQVIEREGSPLHAWFGADGVVAFDFPIFVFQFVAVRREWARRIELPRSRFDWDRERGRRLRSKDDPGGE